MILILLFSLQIFQCYFLTLSCAGVFIFKFGDCKIHVSNPYSIMVTVLLNSALHTLKIFFIIIGAGDLGLINSPYVFRDPLGYSRRIYEKISFGFVDYLCRKLKDAERGNDNL